MSSLSRVKHFLPSGTVAFVAFAAVGLATAVQLALDNFYGDVFPWVTYCFAVFSAAWYGGLRGALLALILGFLAVTLVFVSPGTLGISGKDTITAFAIYVAYGLFAAFVTESLHRARHRAERAARDARDRSQRLRHREEALRASEQRFRIALGSGAITVFEQDLDLRYAWIFPWDPAFNEGNIGKTDAELFPDPDGRELMDLKREVLRSRKGVRRIMRLTLPGGASYYDLVIEARRDSEGRINGVCGAALDVTTQKLAEDALKQADRQKNVFLATLAHELRNPLAAIRYANDAARVGASLNGHTLETIDHQVQHLSSLVDDLLDVSRIAQGKIQLKQVQLDAASVVQRAIASVRPLVETHRHELSIEMAPVAMPLVGDATRLQQIVVNLLTNAAKYTPEGGKIRLSAAPEQGEVVLRVSDNGIGISPQMLPRVFDLFSQVDASLDRSEGGLGIGLTLVRRLVEMHGGTIAATSDGAGRGSQFTVRLPLAKPLAAHVKGGTTVTNLPEPKDALRVLIVDDSQSVTTILGRLLESKGYIVEVAHDGRDGLEATKRFDPQVVLLDIGLPRLSGYDVAKQLRAAEVGKEVTIIALSGYGREEDHQQSVEAGFDHHLVKPVSLEKLLPLLKERSRLAGTRCSCASK